MKKRMISFLTSFMLVVSLVANISVSNVNAESITAENQSEISADNSDVSIQGTNSFGNLLTDSLEEKMNQQEENNGCNIFSIEMIDDSTAAVSFETLQDCMLVVGIYDEIGKTMLASGSLEVYAGETNTYVDIETDSIPEYFYLKAFLIDTDCLRPLCNAYESPNYTQEMQEFLAKTTEDFDQEKVLNFDDDLTNNFAVFSEDTKVIPQTEDTNDVVSVDDENNIYVIENADSSITSLQAKDTFAYEYGDNDVLIVKIADIEFDGTTATIMGEDTSLEEAFDYVKIDTESNSADAQVDASNLEVGITYEGMIESEDDSEVQTYGADLGGSADLALSFKMNDKTVGSAKVSGSVDLKVSASAKVYISLSYQYIELKIDYSAKAVLSLSDKGNGKLPLAYMCFSPIPGLIIEVTPSIVVETSVKAEVSGTLKGCVGFKASNTEGMVNLTKSPTFNPEIKIEGTIFVGISLEPKVKIISDKIASVSMTAKVGAEVKGVLSKKPENNTNSIHECKNCIDGDINAKLTLSFEVKLINCDNLKFTLNLFDWSVKICDFYFSYDFAEFAFISCPHYKYKATVLVTDPDVNNVQGATVKIDDQENQTDENGCVTVYLNNGNYKLTAQKSEVGKSQTTLTVDDNAVKKSMCLNKNSTIGGEDNNNCILSSDGHHSAMITKDGSLYTWGYNYFGQLGDGTKTNSSTPKKIMDNVQSVSLGEYHSAAITKDGSLYIWGYNYYGQLGNGITTNSSTPIKIMDNVQSVSLGGLHSAAITKDGSLYTWGRNYFGQLGNGTTTDYQNPSSPTPIKIMDNVQSVSLGGEHSAAITEDGSLYTWGCNFDGQLGDGTTKYSSIPKKIMDNVQSVSLGESHSAAITKEGSLYTWGENDDGQLGDGTTTDSVTPIKIMDNVQSVSLGTFHSAAITKGGSLYTWGANYYGYLGDGTTTDSVTPIKIMDNVQSVSLGALHSAAITTNGDLYCWGENDYGQVGNGTCENQTTPLKIIFPEIVYESDMISTITRIPGKETIKYGAPSYENTATGDIYDDTKYFIKAMDNYLNVLQTTTKDEAKSINKNKQTKAQLLRNRDDASKDKIITMESGTPDEALNSVYETLAQYLDMYVEEGKSLGEIDVSASNIDISASIINKIRNNLDDIDFQRTVGDYTVKFNVIHFLGAYFGGVSVSRGLGKQYKGTIISSSKGTAKVLNEYINTLSGWTEDALYASLNSVFVELASVTGIASFTRNEIKELLTDKVNTLQNRGYGNVLKHCIKMKDGYDLVSDIVSARNASSLSEVMENAEDICGKLKKLNYSDETVKNATVKFAMDKLEESRKTLQKDFENYINKGDSGKKDWISQKWSDFISIFVQCPVDVEIYDENGNILGSTNRTEYTNTDDIYIDIDGDVKTIIIPSNLKVNFKFTGTDDGTMNYVIEKNVDGKPVGRVNYYDVPLEPNMEYRQELDADYIDENYRGGPISDDVLIEPSEYLSVTDNEANVTIESKKNTGGTVIGDGVYPKGSPVTLTAYPDEGYIFDGWYIDGEVQQLSSECRFAAKENMEIEAKFIKAKERDKLCNIKISDQYQDSTDFIVYKNEDMTDDIIISMLGNLDISTLNVRLEKNVNGSISEEEYSLCADDTHRFLIESVDIQNVDSIQVFDSDNEMLIGTITSKVLSDVTLYGHSISLKENGLIAVNSYWKMSDDFVNNSGAYMVMSINSSASDTNMNNDKIVCVKDVQTMGDYKKFVYELPPAQIGQAVSIDLFDSAGKLIDSSSYSIMEYCYNYLDSYNNGEISENEAEKNLIIALLNYGTNAQEYFKYDVSNPINKDLSNYEKQVLDIQDEKGFIDKYNQNNIVLGDGIQYIGSSLLLKSGCVIRHYFKIEESQINNLSCYVDKGISSERKIQLKKKDNYYYIDIEDIPSYALDRDFKVSICNNISDSKDTIIDYSVYNYIAKTLQKNTDVSLINLMKSLYWYGQYSNALISVP